MKTDIRKPGWLVILLLVLVAIAGCQGGIVGNGRVETRDQKIGDFTRLVITGNFHVFLKQFDKPSLKMEMDENLFDNIKVTEEGSTLRIDSRLAILQAHEKNLFIGIKDLDEIELSGSIKMDADSVIRLESLTILINGAARVEMEIEAKNLKVDLSGASECDFRGAVENLRIHLSGAGDIDAIELISRDVRVDMSGAGAAKVNAKDKLDVSISGVGSVRYRGEPEIHKNISGLGTLKRD
jgi:hypothetical protein